MRELIIIGGSHVEARNWAIEQKLPNGSFRIIDHWEKLMGLENCDVFLVGTWGRLPDVKKWIEVIHSRRGFNVTDMS
jgi:hypothetical protein